MIRAFIFLVMTSIMIVPALAVEPDEILDDPILEVRARDISKNLRCLVCQNQSIDESNAALAKDLRIIVRERLTAGDSDSEVLSFIVDRYGDYVLLKPPFNSVTYALWLGPVFIFLIAGFVGIRMFRRRKSGPSMETTLSEQETAQLQAMLVKEE